MSDFKSFLDVSRAPKIPSPPKGESFGHARYEFNKSTGSIEIPLDAPEGEALEFLEKSGQNPDDWEVTGFRRTEWGDPEDPFIATRFTYARKGTGEEKVSIDMDELAQWLEVASPIQDGPPVMRERAGAVVVIGDNQFGKGLECPEEAIRHALSTIDAAAKEIELWGGAEEILVAFMGDHVEGFVSQGGANAWRTKLTLSEQLRATRRMMVYAMERFASLTDRLVMAAVPGNHGEAQRFSGKGLTTYDDNHDVECLNAVAEAAYLSCKFEHVTFLVPQKDDIAIVANVGGVNWGMVHGHQWRPGKHFEWWAKQTFGNRTLAGADVLLCGHWHHLLIEEAGEKVFIQTPALETESVWWEHAAGTKGNPGLVLIWTDGHEIVDIMPIRAGGV